MGESAQHGSVGRGFTRRTTANQNTYQPAQMSFFTHANYRSRFVLICRDFLFLKLLPRQSSAVAQQAARTCSEKNRAECVRRGKKTKKTTCSGCRKKQKKQRQVTLFPEHQKKKKKISEVITSACFIAPLNKSRPSPGYILTRCIPC